MFSLSSWLWPTPPTPLEIDAFPHVIDAVLESADLSTLLVLRQTCRGMKALVDARFAHIVAGPDGSLRAVPRRPSPAFEEQYEGIDIAPLVDAWCRSAAGGASWFRRRRTVKPFIFRTARQIDRYHCPGQAAPGASPPAPCSGEGEDGCPCSCAPVRGLVHFDNLEAVREWRCPEEAEGTRTPIGARWSLDKHLSSLYALRPAVAAV